MVQMLERRRADEVQSEHNLATTIGHDPQGLRMSASRNYLVYRELSHFLGIRYTDTY